MGKLTGVLPLNSLVKSRKRYIKEQLHGKITIGFYASKPSQDLFSILVDASHIPKLDRFFLVILLIDTNRVNPDALVARHASQNVRC